MMSNIVRKNVSNILKARQSIFSNSAAIGSCLGKRNIHAVSSLLSNSSIGNIGGSQAEFNTIANKTNTSTRRDLATRAQTATDAQTEEQKDLFNEYLSTGRGSQKLFEAVDLDGNGTIEANEIKDFLKAIQVVTAGSEDSDIINEAAWNKLCVDKNAHLNLREFMEWLILATRFATSVNNKEMKESYEQHPLTGERKEPEIEHSWNAETMSQTVRRMQYAVRGEVVMKADALQAEGADVLYTNIGNPHAVEQKPITFYRQVMALCDLPAENGVNHPDVYNMFPADVVDRANEIRAVIGESGTGAYTHSQGVLDFRNHVANYIEDRDGHPSYPGNIFLTNGASTAIDLIMSCLIAESNDAVMIPIPQYPIYSALISRLGGRQVGYELDESLNWAVTREELEKKLFDAQSDNLNIKALAMINPGNPTGQVYSYEDIKVLIDFCSDHGIVLLADEVYQRNVYVDTKKFISAKKVAVDTNSNLQLVSFHSTSKGLIGECGRRGGYMELHNIDPYVQSQIYKLASSGLCSGVPGQIMTSLMVNPPSPSGESYDLFVAQEREIYEGLKFRSKALVDGLNEIDGISCVEAEGSMYAFPNIEVPDKVKELAKENDTTPDVIYALSLLEKTGICVVPGSGFGQAKGRVGFRTTFLPPNEKMLNAIDLFAKHHEEFCKEYS